MECSKLIRKGFPGLIAEKIEDYLYTFDIHGNNWREYQRIIDLISARQFTKIKFCSGSQHWVWIEPDDITEMQQLGDVKRWHIITTKIGIIELLCPILGCGDLEVCFRLPDDHPWIITRIRFF